MYNLPSIVHNIRYLCAALRFTIKINLLSAICNGNITTFSGLTGPNVAKHFLESNEMQKGHMKQMDTKQEIRSTKPEPDLLPFTPQSGNKHHDVCLRVFKASKKTMYTYKTGCFDASTNTTWMPSNFTKDTLMSSV